MSLRIVIDDADTGEEIIFFYRRGRPYLYLRNRVTKRFIRLLERIEKRLFMVVDYDPSRARKGNPLYVDAVGVTLLMPKHIPKLEEIESKMEDMIIWVVKRNFGVYVAFELLELSGIEYGSEITVEEEWEEGRIHYSLIWKHRVEEKGETKEGTLTI